MKKVFGWIFKIIGGLLAALVGVGVLLTLMIWVADPAVLRNIVFGQSPTDPTSIEKSQPQESVIGQFAANILTADPTWRDPSGILEAERYAGATGSVALLIYHRGALRYEKYWSGFDQNTRTNPNSMHKTVLGLLVGAAISDGFIDSVDTPASKWITEWRGDRRSDITIRDLLQMSSGLQVPIFGTWKSARILFGSDLAAGVLELPSVTPRGRDFQYSNANSQLLLLIVERATGQRYSSYLSTRLWQRLGASDAMLWMDHAGGLPRGFCCLFATARDWLRVGRLILDGGRVGDDQVLPLDWIIDMVTPAPTNANFGYQVWLGSPPTQERRYNDYTIKAFHSMPFVRADIIFIDGFGGQRVYVVPSLQLVIVRTGKSIASWDDAIIPNAVIRSVSSGIY
ncbi:MAG: serine hydrolase [Gammaproteobacteria bacterium]|nr:serine hydrolase [Gammaproteobacteria bacterium]